MRSQAAEHSTCSFATLRYLTDHKRDITIPVGVLLWNSTEGWWRMRLPSEEEKIPDVSLYSARPVLEAARAQINNWIETKSLPYSDGSIKPLSTEWWQHVQKLLRFSVLVDTIRPVDCQQPEIEIDTLFEAVVQPHLDIEQKVERIDTAVSRALGLLTKHFHRGEVPGFHGRKVPVLRQASVQNNFVIIEAVNLASVEAERDSDALFGQLSRIRDADSVHGVSYVLGYLASPNGLNGEKPLKEFLEEKIGTPMFDLTRQSQQFQERAAAELATLRGERSLF